MVTVGLAGGCTAEAASTPFVVVQDVPDDVRAELDDVWERFGRSAPARVDCVDEVTVVLVREVAGGDARYLADEQRIEIEIPTSPRRFRESVVHELAHHLDATCSEVDPVREEILGVLDREAEGWSVGETWFTTPDEIWAEALVEVVNGERVRFVRTMPVPPGVVDAVERWASGDDA